MFLRWMEGFYFIETAGAGILMLALADVNTAPYSAVSDSELYERGAKIWGASIQILAPQAYRFHQ